MSVMALDDQKIVETRMRFRDKDVDWHTFVVAEVHSVEFHMLKQVGRRGR